MTYFNHVIKLNGPLKRMGHHLEPVLIKLMKEIMTTSATNKTLHCTRTSTCIVNALLSATCVS